VAVAKAHNVERAQGAGLGEHGVIGRDGAVGVDAVHLAVLDRHVLGVSGVGVVAYADVQLAVGAEVDVAAVVVTRGLGREEDGGRVGAGAVALGEAGHPVLGAGAAGANG